MKIKNKKILRTDNICEAAVIRISWERIFLMLDVQVEYPDNERTDIPLVFYAVNQKGQVGARFKQTALENGRYHLVLNITNQGENHCVEQGIYNLAVCQGKRILTFCETEPLLAGKLDQVSRNYLLDNRKKVYTVSFFVEEDSDRDMAFKMYFMTSAQTEMGFQKERFFANFLYDFSTFFWEKKKEIFIVLYSCFRKLHGRGKKTILFLTEQSNMLGGNLKAVYERMKNRGMDEQYLILTSAREASAKGQTKASWVKLLKKLAMSDMVIVDDHVPVLDWLVLDSDTQVIQLWHAGAGFKSSGYSRWGHPGCPAPYSAHRQYKYGIAGSKQIAPFFSEVWGINDEQVLPTGMPRMDEYLNPEYRKKKEEELYQKYPICRYKKVILFAPTYRGKNKKDAYYPCELIDFSALYEVCGNEYVVLFKLHPWVSEHVFIAPAFSDKFLDVGNYPNINDLFYITELLITDYSSNIYEYSLMRKPMVFFAFDKIQYAFSRGFHRDYDQSAPGKICSTFEEVLDAISKRDFQYEKVQRYIDQHFDYVDCHAADRVIDWIILGNLPDNIKKDLQAVEDANAAMREICFSYNIE